MIPRNAKELKRLLVYTNKLDKLEEMDTFLDIYYLPILKHEEIEILNNRLNTYKEIKTVIENSIFHE